MKRSLLPRLAMAALWCSIVIATSACEPEFEDLRRSDLPVHVSRAGTDEVDLDVIWGDISAQVEDLLPGSYLNGIGLRARTEELPDLKGRLNFYFVQVRPRLFQDRVVAVVASVDSNRSTMNLWATDVSGNYWVTTPSAYPGHSVVKRLAGFAQDIARQCCSPGSTNDLDESLGEWSFNCYPQAREGEYCNFRIDPLTGIATPRQ